MEIYKVGDKVTLKENLPIPNNCLSDKTTMRIRGSTFEVASVYYKDKIHVYIYGTKYWIYTSWIERKEDPNMNEEFL